MKKCVFHALKQVTSNFTTMDRRDKNKPSNLYFESTPTCSQDTEKMPIRQNPSVTKPKFYQKETNPTLKQGIRNC